MYQCRGSPVVFRLRSTLMSANTKKKKKKKTIVPYRKGRNVKITDVRATGNIDEARGGPHTLIEPIADVDCSSPGSSRTFVSQLFYFPCFAAPESSFALRINAAPPLHPARSSIFHMKTFFFHLRVSDGSLIVASRS